MKTILTAFLITISVNSMASPRQADVSKFIVETKPIEISVIEGNRSMILAESDDYPSTYSPSSSSYPSYEGSSSVQSSEPTYGGGQFSESEVIPSQSEGKGYTAPSDFVNGSGGYQSDPDSN